MSFLYVPNTIRNVYLMCVTIHRVFDFLMVCLSLMFVLVRVLCVFSSLFLPLPTSSFKFFQLYIVTRVFVARKVLGENNIP